jgi:hypothetical protein
VDDGLTIGALSDQNKMELDELKEYKISRKPLERFLGIEIRRFQKGILFTR